MHLVVIDAFGRFLRLSHPERVIAHGVGNADIVSSVVRCHHCFFYHVQRDWYQRHNL